jgi:hypothetical protein
VTGIVYCITNILKILKVKVVEGLNVPETEYDAKCVCEIGMKLNCCGIARGEYEITNRTRTRECCDNIKLQ